MTAPGAAVERKPAWIARLRAFLAPRARTWGLMVPLHLMAFLVLYVATLRLLESEIVDAAGRTAESQMRLVTGELRAVAVAHRGDSVRGHLFAPIVAGHVALGLQLFLPDGSIIPSREGLSRPQPREVLDFLAAPPIHRAWLSEEGDGELLRGLMKVQADSDCAPCHPVGNTLAVASISTDLTELMGRVRARSRRNLALLIVAWAGLLGLVTAVVRGSAHRAAARLEADLAAAEEGQHPPSDDPSGELVLDPVSAKLHQSLRQFLERQRRRHQEVASRLAHTDQLATLGQLAAGLAHEIKNPLAGIQGALEILRQDVPEPASAELCDEMLGELRRVNETLHTLLSSARPSPPRLATTDLRELLGDVLRLMEPNLRRRAISLELDLPAEPVVVHVDPGMIRQVLVNLINNAAEALDLEGRITLRAGLFPETDEVIVAVQDDGPGIPAEQQQKIFEPFFTTKFSGTGLGLAIARSLVEQHGGSLHLESERGQGATFYLLLPARAGSVTPAPAATEAGD